MTKRSLHLFVLSARQRGVRVPAGVYAKGVVQFLRQRVGVCIKGGVRHIGKYRRLGKRSSTHRKAQSQRKRKTQQFFAQ